MFLARCCDGHFFMFCFFRKVCRRVAELYPKNYYAWTQRSWVVLRFVGSATAAGVDERTAAMGEAHELVSPAVRVISDWRMNRALRSLSLSLVSPALSLKVHIIHT